MSLLHRAITNGNDDQVLWLLERGADANEPDETGTTPLMLAVRVGVYPETLQALLDHGADVRATDREGANALMLALDLHDPSIGWIDVLLKRYAALGEAPVVDTGWQHGRLALFLAVHQGDTQRVRALLDAGVGIETRCALGYTPLMRAAEAGHAAIVRLLLERGADTRAVEQGGDGSTALHMAAYEGHAECVRLLLDHGADVNARDQVGATPLVCAAFASSAPAVRVLLAGGAGVFAEDTSGTSALSQAGWLADEETIRLLLDAGAGRNARHLQDALHACFTDNNSDKAGLLIAAGARVGVEAAAGLAYVHGTLAEVADLVPNATPEEARQAIAMAAWRHDTQSVRLLLKHPAVRNCLRGSVLAVAAGDPWDEDVAQALRDAGADPNATGSSGETALTALYQSEDAVAYVQHLVELGADVDVPSARGTTPLIRACECGVLPIARALLEAGADPNRPDGQGRTPLMRAAEYGEFEICRLLLDRGADPRAQDREGHTALWFGEGWVGKGIAEMLLQAQADWRRKHPPDSAQGTR